MFNDITIHTIESRVEVEMILNDETAIFKTHHRGINMFPKYFEKSTLIAYNLKNKEIKYISNFNDIV